jgi:hypothetical protein
MKDLKKSNVKAKAIDNWANNLANALIAYCPQTVNNRGLTESTVLASIKSHRRQYFSEDPTLGGYVTTMAGLGSRMCQEFEKELEIT